MFGFTIVFNDLQEEMLVDAWAFAYICHHLCLTREACRATPGILAKPGLNLCNHKKKSEWTLSIYFLWCIYISTSCSPKCLTDPKHLHCQTLWGRKSPYFSSVLNVFLCRVYLNTNDVALYCKLRNSQNVMVNPKEDELYLRGRKDKSPVKFSYFLLESSVSFMPDGVVKTIFLI